MKKNRTLIWGFDNNFCLDILKEFKKHFTFSYVVNSHSQFSHTSIQKLTVNAELLKYQINPIILKNYHKFFNEHFIQFYTKIVSRGINLRNLHEVKNEFSMYLHFFYNLISQKKINLIIMQSMPHQGPDYIIYILAKFFKIKIIMFYQTLFANKYFILKNIDELGKNKTNKNKKYRTFSFKEIKNNELARYTSMVEAVHTYNNSRNKRQSTLNHQIRSKIRNLLIKSRVISRIDEQKKYLKNLDNFVYKKNINSLLKKKFVYFPLHDQPELTTSTLGGIYEDQVFALEKLRNIIDDDCSIVIKEHHFQGFFQRENLFFQRIRKIKNLYMVPKNYSSNLLIKKCLFCSTIVGTAGWEALLEKKKSLIFGNSWYQKIHGCITYNDSLNKNKLKKLIKKRFDTKLFSKSYSKLIGSMFEGVISPYYTYLLKKFDNKKNAKNVTRDVIKILKNYN